MSTFAAAVARGKNGWTASELELTGIADLDEVVDRLRDAEPDAELSLLFVEADDQYLVILRLDEGEDLRVFGSDSAYADESRVGALLLADVETPALELDDLAVPPAGGRRRGRPPGGRPRRRPGGRRRAARRPRGQLAPAADALRPRGHAARPT